MGSRIVMPNLTLLRKSGADAFCRKFNGFIPFLAKLVESANDKDIINYQQDSNIVYELRDVDFDDFLQVN